MSGFFIPSYLDYSDGEANFKALADSFTRNGPIRFKPISGYYTAVPDDTDVVLRCDTTTEITVPADVFGERNFAPGAQIAVLNYSEKRVVIEPAKGVTINGPERLSVDRWRWGVLVKQNANLWLLSLGNLGGGDAKGVPLPPKITSCFGVSAGAVINWSPPVDDGGSAITQYIIEQSLDEKEWTGCGLTKPNELTLTVDDLTVDVKYHFRVKAVNANGISDPSNVADATPTQKFNEASGGTVSNYKLNGRYFRVHTFTADGEFTVSKNPVPFQILAVAGGYGGSYSGSSGAGQGGAGGAVVQVNKSLDATKFAVKVGAGGALANSASPQSKAGGESSLGGTLVSAVGARGGGDGVPTMIWGTEKFVSGGGGGGGSMANSFHVDASDGAPGGKGGGGRGAGGGSADPCTECGRPSSVAGAPGEANTGGGGGGSGAAGGFGQGYPGGSGVVAVAYEVAPFNEAEGGAVSTYTKDGKKYKVHTFTDNSTLIVKSAARPFRILCVGAGAGRSGGNPSCCGGPGCERGPDRGGGGNYYLNDNDTLAAQSYPVVVGVGGNRGPDGCCDAGSCGCCPGGGGKAGSSGGASSIAGKVGAGGTGSNQGSGAPNHFVTTDITGTSKQYGDNGGGDQGGRGIVIVSYEIDPNVTEFDEGQVPEELPLLDTVVYPDGNTWRLQGSEYVHEPSADIAEVEEIVKGAKRANRKGS